MTANPVTSPSVGPIPNDMTKNCRPADTNLATTLAANNMALVEFITGRAADPDASPLTAPNPQGLVGADLSGYPWGPARKGVVWLFVGGKQSTSPWGFDNVHYLDTSDIRNPALLLWYAKPFAEGPTAPARKVRLYGVAGLLSASATSAKLEVFKDTTLVASATVAFTATTTDKLVDFGIELPQRNGWNRYTMRWTRVTGSAVPVVTAMAACLVDS